LSVLSVSLNAGFRLVFFLSFFLFFFFSFLTICCAFTLS
jgi:hypothetical protein